MNTSFKEKPLGEMIGMLVTRLSVPIIRVLHFRETQLEHLENCIFFVLESLSSRKISRP